MEQKPGQAGLNVGKGEEKRLTHEEFIFRAIRKLPKPPYVGLHVRYSGFPEAWAKYFGNVDYNPIIDKMIADGKLTHRLSKGGITVYIPGTDPREKRTQDALDKILA